MAPSSSMSFRMWYQVRSFVGFFLSKHAYDAYVETPYLLLIQNNCCCFVRLPLFDWIRNTKNPSVTLSISRATIQTKSANAVWHTLAYEIYRTSCKHSYCYGRIGYVKALKAEKSFCNRIQKLYCCGDADEKQVVEFKAKQLFWGFEVSLEAFLMNTEWEPLISAVFFVDGISKGVLKGEGADLALRPPEKILTCLPPNIERPWPAAWFGHDTLNARSVFCEKLVYCTKQFLKIILSPCEIKSVILRQIHVHCFTIWLPKFHRFNLEIEIFMTIFHLLLAFSEASPHPLTKCQLLPRQEHLRFITLLWATTSCPIGVPRRQIEAGTSICRGCVAQEKT